MVFDFSDSKVTTSVHAKIKKDYINLITKDENNLLHYLDGFQTKTYPKEICMRRKAIFKYTYSQIPNLHTKIRLIKTIIFSTYPICQPLQYSKYAAYKYLRTALSTYLKPNQTFCKCTFVILQN